MSHCIDGIDEKRKGRIIDMRSSDTIFETLSFFEWNGNAFERMEKVYFRKFDENQRLMAYK